MDAHAWAIGTTSFLASAVEMVEALTIVLAVGVTRGWGRALGAAACAVLVLGVAIAVAGPLLPALVANHWVKFVVGLIALYIGSTWLRKAVLRASGRKAMRDEALAYTNDIAKLERSAANEAFMTAFSGVLTEGVEVVAIVLALGSGTALTLGAAAGGALVAVLAVVAVGLVVHKPLSRVPENAMKYVVGVMVTAFGVFWVGEGLNIAWPANDVALFYLAAAILVAAGATTAALRTGRPAAS